MTKKKLHKKIRKTTNRQAKITPKKDKKTLTQFNPKNIKFKISADHSTLPKEKIIVYEPTGLLSSRTDLKNETEKASRRKQQKILKRDKENPLL